MTNIQFGRRDGDLDLLATRSFRVLSHSHVELLLGNENDSLVLGGHTDLKEKNVPIVGPSHFSCTLRNQRSFRSWDIESHLSGNECKSLRNEERGVLLTRNSMGNPFSLFRNRKEWIWSLPSFGMMA